MKGKWFSFGCLTSVVIVILMIVFLFASLNNVSSFDKSKLTTKVADNSVLHLKISGNISEYNELKDDFFMSPFAPKTFTAHDIIEKIKMATNDPRIDSIILEPKWISAGYATLHEISQALKEFQKSGKPVYAYLEMCGNKDYFLASCADKIYLNPSASAGILLTGVGSNMLFYKDLFEKVGVEMTVLHAGEYKGAGENYYRTSLSAPVKKNLTSLFSDIYDNITHELAENRGISIEDITYIYEQRDDIFINQNKAIEYNLVDELAFKEEVISQLISNENQLIAANKYKVKKLSAKDKDKIAVIYAQGQIAIQTSGLQQNILSAKKLSNAIDKILNDNTIKGTVIRIDSPGGSALESEIMHNKLKELKARMPVVISMANVAASGGYYISTPSDYVFADPFTITGSIGVVAMFPNISALNKKIGITTDKIEKGKYSNILNLYEKPDQATLTSFKKGIDKTYIEFKTRVANGRNISLNDVEKVAKG
ncbi:MAG: signal peptide peptidase SppA, partial [Candidatus Cloacimonetes bacterium]|nr:signal peptide peptidase SppA [Candidatus Cloacimonadota bacterium]